MKTLIIDDSKTIRKVLRQALLNVEFEYVKFEENALYEAEDGLVAFSILGKEKDIQLLISDVNMPHLSGTDLMELLADTEKLGSIKVIFVTTEDLNPALISRYKNNILGLIKKPISPKKLKEHIDIFLNPINLNDGISQEEFDKNKEVLEENIKKVVASISEYAKLEDLSIEIDEEFIKNGLLDYLDPSVQTDAEEILATSYIVLDEYFHSVGAKEHIDNKKLSNIFHKNDLIEKYQDSIDLFDDENDFDFGRFSEDEVFDYFKDKESFEFTYDIPQVVEKYFTPILLSMSDVGTISSKYSIDYENFSPLLFEMIKYFTHLDYSFENEDIIKYRHYLNKFAKYQSTLYDMKENMDKEKLFNDIFMMNQHDFLLIDYAKSTLELEKETLEHLEKILSTVKANHIVNFYTYLLKYLDNTITNISTILNYYTYVLERIIWKNVKRNQTLKSKLSKLVHFNSRDFFIMYYKKMKVSAESIENIEKYFEKLKRDVIVLSNDYKDAEIIKEALVKINKYNPISITTPKMLETQLSKKYPEIIFIEDKYGQIDTNEYINKLFKNYKLENHVTVFLMYKDQLNISSHFIDGYIKKPLTEQILLQNINNI